MIEHIAEGSIIGQRTIQVENEKSGLLYCSVSMQMLFPDVNIFVYFTLHYRKVQRLVLSNKNIYIAIQRVVYELFKNSLIIHKENTKEINV